MARMHPRCLRAIPVFTADSRSNRTRFALGLRSNSGRKPDLKCNRWRWFGLDSDADSRPIVNSVACRAGLLLRC
jgi:hypothetical protein